MQDVYIIGVGMMRFGKFYERNIKSLAAEAVQAALADAGISRQDLQAAWVSNAAQGIATGQECIRGQIALRPLGIDGIPIMNVENACASGSSAVHGCWMSIQAGLYDCVLALGMEKMAHPDKLKVFQSFFAGTDVEELGDYLNRLVGFNQQLEEMMAEKGMEVGGEASMEGAGKTRSGAMDIYSLITRYHMYKYGTTQRQLAVIASKNHWHSSMNPLAQYQYEISVEEVLKDKEIAWPLTRAMCAPIGDGAAAAVLCSGDFLAKMPEADAVKVRASTLASGREREMDGEDISERLSRRAYEMAGAGPEDIDLAEVHDATAYGELHQTEALGFCPEGEGGALAESGATRVGGSIPINTSGGLESRGHPIGASGIAQMYELVTQLRRRAGERQVEGARLALAMNGGGILGFEEAAMCVHILEGGG
jgi:acetyl-CoA acetyltransferase